MHRCLGQCRQNLEKCSLNLSENTLRRIIHVFQHRSFATVNAESPLDTINAPSQPGALLAFHSDKHEVPLDEKHRFPMSKYRLTRVALESDTSTKGLIEIREVNLYLGRTNTHSPLLHKLLPS